MSSRKFLFAALLSILLAPAAGLAQFTNNCVLKATSSSVYSTGCGSAVDNGTTFAIGEALTATTATFSSLTAGNPVCASTGGLLSTTNSCGIATLGGSQTFSGAVVFTGSANFNTGSFGVNAVAFNIGGTTLVSVLQTATLANDPTGTATSGSNFASTTYQSVASYWNGSAQSKGGFLKISAPAVGSNPLITLNHTFNPNVESTSGGTATGQETFSYNVNFSSINGVVPIAPIQLAMPTSLIANGACTSYTSTTMTGLATTSTVTFQNSTDDTGVTGWDPTAASLTIDKYPMANTLYWRVCNTTGASITPAAITMNVSAK